MMDMLWISIKRVSRGGFINFFRNGTVSLAAVLTLSVTLFVMGALILGGSYLKDILNDIQDKVDIAIAFKLDSEESEILKIKTDLSLIPGVKEVTYSSREDELESFRERHKDNALLIQSLDEVGNPFGARLNVKAIDPTHYESVAKFLQSDSGLSSGASSIIDNISFKKDIVDRLIGVISSSRKVGVIISIILMLLSVLVTINTISLTIYTSREEISLMRLVGASDSYVQGPFIVEGIISGLISSFVAMILLYPSVIWIKQTTAGVYGGVNLLSYYISDFAILFLILIFAGVVLSAFSSYIAIRKYLK